MLSLAECHTSMLPNTAATMLPAHRKSESNAIQRRERERERAMAYNRETEQQQQRNGEAREERQRETPGREETGQCSTSALALGYLDV